MMQGLLQSEGGARVAPPLLAPLAASGLRWVYPMLQSQNFPYATRLNIAYLASRAGGNHVDHPDTGVSRGR